MHVVLRSVLQLIHELFHQQIAKLIMRRAQAKESGASSLLVFWRKVSAALGVLEARLKTRNPNVNTPMAQ